MEEWTKQYELLYTEADHLWQLWLDEIKATPNAIQQMAELMESPRFKDALAAHEKSSQFYREHVR